MTGGFWQLIRRSAGTFAARVAVSVIALAIHLFLARSLGAAPYGTYSYCLAWAAALSAVSELGFPVLLIQKSAEYHVRSDWAHLRGLLRYADRMVLISACTLAVIALPIGWLTTGDDEVLRSTFGLGLVAIPLWAALQLRNGALAGLGRVVLGEVTTRLTLRLLFAGLLAMAAVSGHLSPPLAMGCYLAAAVLTVAAAAVGLRRAAPPELWRASPAREKGWLASALPMFIVGYLTMFGARLGVILVGSLDAIEVSGLFAAAADWGGATAYPFIAFEIALQPTISRMHVEGDHEGLQRLIRRGVRWIFLGSIPLCLGVVLLGEQLLGLYGEEFTRAHTALAILTVGELAAITLGPVFSILLMTGHARDVAWLQGGVLALHVALGIALVPPYGMVGAAAAAVAAQLLLRIAAARVVRSRLGIRSTLV